MNGGFDFGTAITLLRMGKRVVRRGHTYELFEGAICRVDGPARVRWEPTHAALLADDWRLVDAD